MVADAGVIGIVDAAAETELSRAFIVPADETLAKLCKAASKSDPRLTELAEHIKVWTEERTASYKWYVNSNLDRLRFSH